MKHETLYHTYAKNPCGYCKKKEVSITVPQLRKKECLKKQCWHLVKYNDHPYWTQREAERRKKKENKKKRDEKIKALTIHNYSVELRSDSI